MIHFQCYTSIIKKVIEKLSVVHKRALPHQVLGCEITLTDGHVKMALPGAVFGFECETKGTAKAVINFAKLKSILEHHNHEYLRVTFLDETLHVGSVIVKAKTVFFKDDKILRTIYLPNNYSDLDLLRLPLEGYTPEELEFNGYKGEIERARSSIAHNIRKATNLLKVYGITTKDIKTLVEERLKEKLSLDTL